MENEVNAHRLVAHVCEQMAHDIYEECASKYNNWYAMNPDRVVFVRQCAPTLREHARRVLAEMLGRKDVDADEKKRIHEALMLDSAIPQTGLWTMPPQGNA